jgi:hypothetical protein
MFDFYQEKIVYSKEELIPGSIYNFDTPTRPMFHFENKNEEETVLKIMKTKYK